MTDTCENCKFWKPDKMAPTGPGSCRIRSPSVQVFMLPGGAHPLRPGMQSVQVQAQSAWPPVRKDEWCGEYSRKLDG